MTGYSAIRLSVAIASCSVLAALIAACSASQGTPPVTPQGDLAFAGGRTQIPRGHMSREDMIRWFLAGKMLGFGTRKQMEQALRAMETAKLKHRQPKGGAGKPAIWVSDPYDNEILGVSANGKKVVGKPIAVSGCAMWLGMKVDRKGNIWQSCEEISVSSGQYAEPGAVELSPKGKTLASYAGGCPANIPASQCQYWYSEGIDVAATTHDVFESVSYYENEYYCGYSFCYSEGYGFFYWPRGGGQGSVINVAGAISDWKVQEVAYADADDRGNLWAFAYACESVYPYTCGTGIIEVQNPTSGSPTITNPVPFGSMPGAGYWGMVYVSNEGKVLNVTDPDNSTTYRWSLPKFTSLTSLGPCGTPLLGGFDRGSKTLIQPGISGSESTLDFVTVKSNKCRIGQTPGFVPTSRRLRSVRQDHRQFLTTDAAASVDA